MKQFIEKNFKLILLFFCVLFFLQQCSTSRKADKAYKQAKLAQESVDSLIKAGPLTAEQVHHISQQVMFEFLIYEEDIDKGRASLSDIKNKIEKK
jgi:arsenate reductase-like glutaredoxin family protein